MLPPSFIPGQNMRGQPRQVLQGGRVQQMTPQGLVPQQPIQEKKGWIQQAKSDIKRRGTEGVCTGSKFGGPSCRPGTKRYNLAKTFKKMSHKKD